jgi:hypothetical protein
MATVKFFRVISQVEWLNGEQTNVSGTTWSSDRYRDDGRHNPEDEDRDGPRNVGLFTVQPLDPADNQKELRCRRRNPLVRCEQPQGGISMLLPVLGRQ